MELKRKFIKGVMNKDVDERLIPDGQYIDAVNVDVINAEGSDAGTIRNVKGNTLVGDVSTATSIEPTNPKTIGAVVDEANNRVYWFVSADNLDGIYEYDEGTGNIDRVLESTTGQLSFDTDYYITGLNIIDGFLYWTDNLNAPRRVNISFAKSFNVNDDRIDEYIDVIVAAPLRAPSIEMKESSVENNMEDKFLQFSYRYKYRDNQYSALSPYSAVAFIPGDYEFDYASGNNEAMLNSFSDVEVTVETGNRFVEEIQVVVRDTKSLNTYIVETFDKSVLNISNYSTHSFIFKNNKIYSALPSDQVTRLFDNVPIKAKAQEIIDRRLIYGNYTQFYDIVDCEGEDINIDYEVDYVSEATTSGTPIQTFRSDRDYEIGIIYGDDYGRFTTVLTNSEKSGKDTVYIPATQSDKGNSLIVNINHKAPCFATNYRLVIKESKKSYYNIFPILYYADGVYRYFLINESDKNKFAVGDYVIFKADSDGPTYSNKKYKILEFEAKPKNFLDNNEISGLYFKIQDEDADFSSSSLVVSESQGIGSNDITNLNTCNKGSKNAIEQGSESGRYAEDPIFYGVGANDLGISNNHQYNLIDDTRFIIEIDGTDTFRYKLSGVEPISSVNGNTGWIQSGIQITGADQDLSLNDIGGTSIPQVITIRFGGVNGHTVGDRWVINCRGEQGGLGIFGRQNPLHSSGNPYQGGSNNNVYGGTAISNLNDNAELQINAGAVISIKIVESYGATGAEQVFPPSSKNYANIEEWFFGDQIYNQFEHFDASGNDRGAYGVFFRRAKDFTITSGGGNGAAVNDVSQGGSVANALTYPVRMFITGYGTFDNTFLGCDQNIITVDWKVTQLDSSLLAETEPLEIDDQIYHEITRTFPIENRQHKVRWEYEDYLDVSTAYPTLVSTLSALPTPINIGGKTVIGQATPGAATTADNIPHLYHVGDILYVVSSSTTYGPQAPPLATGYEVLYVIDDYNVVIDIDFTSLPGGGPGPVTSGTVSLFSPIEPTIEDDQNSPTQAAIIKINHPQNENGTYNAYAFGNGLESDRIRDDFNETELQYSPRASTVIDNYEQETKEASVCYSGIYKGDTSINRLNEFNLSKANFKNLDREFGSVQKLFARDTDLLVLQENKTSKVLYGKNLLSDSAGGGQISSVPEVLGTQMAYAGDYGISFNPESFAEWGNSIWWCDERRGAVLQMTAGQIVDVAKYGMKDFFRDAFKENPKTQKLGVYDPYRNQYVLASNESTSLPCSLRLSINGQKYPATSNGLIDINDERPDFYVYSNTSWTCSISYTAGSNWVAGFPASGFGDQAIFLGVANNNAPSVRKATLTFTYCGGLTATFVVTQARGRRITVTPIVAHNGNIIKF
jgi:hypothetical protein